MELNFIKTLIFLIGVFAVYFYWSEYRKKPIFNLRVILGSVFIPVQLLGYLKILPMKINLIWEIIGLFIYIFGIFLMLWAKRLLDRNWNPEFRLPKDLVISGPYKFVRHPIYLGMAVFLIGIELAAKSWLFIILGILILFTSYFIALKEEKTCLEVLDEQYKNYQRQTPSCLIPGDFLILNLFK